MSKCKIIALANQKGGTGKTATAVNLGKGLTKEGKRVLLVDADPQGDLTRRSGTFQDLDYICCSTYGRPRSKDFHWRHYKKLLEDNGLPNIRWYELRSTICTILLKNNFNPKAVSQLMGHAKEIITIDVYGDNVEIIEGCLDDLQPFIDEVVPKEESESSTDFSEDSYTDNLIEFPV